MSVVGGREVHPINLRVGGWYRAPRKRELAPLVEKLERAREIALATVKLTASLDFPDYERDYELVALSEPGEYAIDRGRIVSNGGIDIDVSEYDEHFAEEHVEWSNALHSQLIERGSYLCGPLARFALGFDRLCASRAMRPSTPVSRRRAQSVPEHHRPRGRARVRG